MVLLFLHVCDDLFTVFQLLKKKKLLCQHLPMHLLIITTVSVCQRRPP